MSKDTPIMCNLYEDFTIDEMLEDAPTFCKHCSYASCPNYHQPSGDCSEPCFLVQSCPFRAAPCSVVSPEDDGCYVYRKFRDIFKKQGLLKEDSEGENK